MLKKTHVAKIPLGFLVGSQNVCATTSDIHESESHERVDGSAQQPENNENETELSVGSSHPRHEHDGEERFVFWVERFETAFEEQSLSWDAEVWHEGDTPKVFFATDGVVSDQDSEMAFGIRFTRASERFWDLQSGLTVGLSHTDGDTYETSLTGHVGFLGVLPFDVQSEVMIALTEGAALFVQYEFQRDLPITSKINLQTLLTVESPLNDSDLSSIFDNTAIEIGLRIRYELKQRFAPYIGLVWTFEGDGDSDDLFSEHTGIAGDDNDLPTLLLGTKFFF